MAFSQATNHNYPWAVILWGFGCLSHRRFLSPRRVKSLTWIWSSSTLSAGTDGLPVVPPTQDKINAVVQALGGDADFVECKVAPRWGSLTRKVLAINMIMAGCKPEYSPVVRAAMLALTDVPFNLNGVQATTHMASPLV